MQLNTDYRSLTNLFVFITVGLVLSPTHDGGTYVDSEARQCGWLTVVWEQKGLEAEPLLHTRKDAHAVSTDAIAQLNLLLGVRHLIRQTWVLRLVPGATKYTHKAVSPHFTFYLHHLNKLVVTVVIEWLSTFSW